MEAYTITVHHMAWSEDPRWEGRGVPVDAPAPLCGHMAAGFAEYNDGDGWAVIPVCDHVVGAQPCACSGTVLGWESRGCGLPPLGEPVTFPHRPVAVNDWVVVVGPDVYDTEIHRHLIGRVVAVFADEPVTVRVRFNDKRLGTYLESSLAVTE